MTILAIGLGGFFGAISRYLISSGVFHLISRAWVGTFVVNLIGCSLFFLFTKLNWPKELFPKSLLLTGFLGSLTTFSTYAFNIVELVKLGHYSEAALCLFLNIFFGVLIGIWLLE